MFLHLFKALEAGGKFVKNTGAWAHPVASHWVGLGWSLSIYHFTDFADDSDSVGRCECLIWNKYSCSFGEGGAGVLVFGTTAFTEEDS